MALKPLSSGHLIRVLFFFSPPLFSKPIPFHGLLNLLVHLLSEVKVAQSCPTICKPMDYTVHGILQARILEWVAFPFPTQGSNPGLPHCRWILYQLSHKRSPKGIISRIDAAAAAAKSLQSCPTLCDPVDGSPPGSPVPGILQARTLEWVAISFSNA